MTSGKYLCSSAGILALIAALLFIPAAYAEEVEGCAAAQAMNDSGQRMILWQHTFADGTHDLVMATSPSVAASGIKRVTFGGSTNNGCQYPALAIARGIGWGWHLAWVNSNGLYYARMDGEAWVSSPPRHMADRGVTTVELQTSGQQVTLVWQQKSAPGKRYRAVSEDEGRSWDAAQAMP